MRRRKFITLVGGATLALPLGARAQQPKLPRIGVLILANTEPFWGEFREGLRRHGYIEGQNIQFEFRSAEGKPDLLRGLADELVRLKVDIIVALFTPAVTTARQATSEIPIVMMAGAPVETGLISSLARPGGNITGLSGTGPELGAKLLEITRDMLPSTRRGSGQCDRSLYQAVPRADRAGRPHPGHRNPGDPGPRRGGVRRGVRRHGQGAGGCRHRAAESTAQGCSRLGAQISPAGGLIHPVVSERGRPDGLRRKPKRLVPARGLLHRSDSQGREARRPAGGAADQVRACYQSQDRQGARHYDSRVLPGSRRRGDRITSVMSLVGPSRRPAGLPAMTKRSCSTAGYSPG
ncbi:MAG: hypothetical protein EXQ87_00435 [Alphaproteobacteria bacterium]|nr:hypothetical protein [Alphaproteobacteria bacterium]